MSHSCKVKMSLLVKTKTRHESRDGDNEYKGSGSLKAVGASAI
jgi:hypothetical protein